MHYLFSIAIAAIAAMILQSGPNPHLSINEFIVSDTAKYESLRLKVINDSDSLAVIERALPSCGCVLVTVQKNIAVKGNPGDIYVAVTSAKVPPLQPITVDVYTSLNRTVPLRLVIRRAEPRDSVKQELVKQDSILQSKGR